MKHHNYSIFFIFALSILTSQNYQLIQSTLPKGGSNFRASPSLTYFAFRDVNEFNIYYQSNNTFTYLFSIGKYYTPTTSTLSDCLILDSPPRAFCPTLTIIGPDQITAIRITNISQTSGITPHIDNILITSTPDTRSTLARIQGSSNALIVITYTTTHVFLWDSAIGIYTLVYNNVFANTGSKLVDITDDGAFFVQEIGPVNSILRLFTYSGGTYTQTDQYDFGATLTTITKITMTGSSSGGTVVVALADTGATYRLDFSSTGSFTTILSTGMTFPSAGSYAGVSSGGNYLMQPAVDPPTIRLYKYDPVIFSYLPEYTNEELFYTPSSNYLQNAEDGSFLYFQYQETVETSPSNAFSYLNIYYQCTIPYCSHCSGIGFCDLCNTGYILSGPICVCPQGTILLRSICQSCNVNFCRQCSAVNVCSSCNDGYEIQGSICACGVNRTISLNSSKCVQCLIADCLRCDVDNICSQYKSGGLLTSVIQKSNDLSKQFEDLKVKQSIILAMLSALIIIILTLLGIIIIRLMAPKSQQNNDTIQTAAVHQHQHFKEMSETNLKATLQKSHLQQNPSTNQIIFQQANLITVPKKRRGKKHINNVQEQPQNIEVIIVSPVIEDVSS